MKKFKLSWTNPKLIKQTILGKSCGIGVIATENVYQGEVLSLFGGYILTLDDLKRLPVNLQDFAYQVSDDLYCGPISREELTISEYFNHSCNPNAGFEDSITLVAMRAIEPDDEVTFDYAMCMSSPVLALACACGDSACRRFISGTDWQNGDLQQRYAGYFIPYLRRKISSVANIN